jgi:hypothetical protein
LLNLNTNQLGEYEFAGTSSGYISIDKFKSPINNFSLSFFGYSDNWNKPLGNQILGNYLDTGFGIFNFKEVNPLNFYFNGTDITIYNDISTPILNIKQPPSLSGNVVGLFRREFFENFHIILDNLNILEYNLEGTLVDVVSGTNVFPRPNEKNVISYHNNLNTGVLLFEDLTYVVVDLKTNNINFVDLSTDNSVSVNFDDAVRGDITVYIDPFGKIYKVNGKMPLIREDKLYYVDNFDRKKLMAYNTVSTKINEYIDTKVLARPALPQKVEAGFTNLTEVIREFPYSSFDLSNLSGAGLTLITPTPQIPNNSRYHVGLSIYKEPYVFFDTLTESYTSRPSINPVYVDLHGNYWYDHTTLPNPEPLNSDGFGKKNFLTKSNIFYVGDPYYQEILGATTGTYGKVFVYGLLNNKLSYLNSFDVGPVPFIYTIKYDSSLLISTPLSTFPLQTFLRLPIGDSIRTHPTLGGTARRYQALSGIAIAFGYVYPSGATSPLVYDYPTDGSPDTFTRSVIPFTFTGTLTSMFTIARQLTAQFNTTPCIPVFGQAPQPLNTFYKLDLINLTENVLEYRLTCRYPGSLIRNSLKQANDGLVLPVFTSLEPIGGSPYMLQPIKQGANGRGLDGNEFGFEIKSISDDEVRKEQIVLISSPNSVESYAIPPAVEGDPPTFIERQVGRVEVFKDVVYSYNRADEPFNSENRLIDFSNYNEPQAIILAQPTDEQAFPNGLRFGHSIALSGSSDVTGSQSPERDEFGEFFINTPYDGTNKKVIIGAPTTNTTNYPFASAFFYNIKYPDLEVVTISALNVRGPGVDGFGLKVDIHNDIYGVGSPYRSNNTGRINLYRYQYYAQEDTFSSLGTQVIDASAGRFRFGLAFKLNGRYLAAASLGYTGINVPQPAILLIDIFKRNGNLYTLHTTLTGNVEDGNRPLSSYNFDVNINDTHITAGCWRGNEADLGDEYGKVFIWYYKQDNFYPVYENKYVNDIPIAENDLYLTYYGNTVAMAEDKIFTGTTFINNTGNSLFWASSAIAAAINTQTDRASGYDAKVLFAGNNEFGITVTGKLSARSAASSVVRNVLTTSSALCAANRFYELSNFDGSTLLYNGNILSYSFDKNEETIILTDYSNIKIYDVLGEPRDVISLFDKGMSTSLSAFKFSIQSTVKNREVKEDYTFFAISPSRTITQINYNPKTDFFLSTEIDTRINPFLTNTRFLEQIVTYEDLTRRHYDINNNNVMLGDIRLKYPEPSISFKIRLNNRLDYEESAIFAPLFFTENLSRGWHHFTIVFDSVNGVYKGYIDLKPIFNKKFTPNKYSFSTVLKNNLIVGSSPYYNNINFNDFYNSPNSNFFVDGLNIDKIKFYNKALTESEIRFLTYEKQEPEDLKVEIDFGSRDYIDTISRMFRQSPPGRKSPFINIVINDSLITDKELQKYYETKIIMELKEFLPSYVKINKIEWVSNKPSREKIVQGDINIGNTLTNSGGIE